MERRSFLHGSALGIVAATAPWLHAPELARAAGGHLLELASRPCNYESLRDTFTSRITPIERFYIRNHFDIPDGNPAAWGDAYHLNVAGMVERPLALTLAQLEKMPQVTVEAVLQCAGNGRGLFRPRVPGVQWRWGAMGNAEWTGVRLKDVLAQARPKRGARHVQVQGSERPADDKTPRFIRAIPVEKALHPDTLIALRMNGKPLAPQHGFPARLVVPGWVGDDWMKWLSDIELRADEPAGFFYQTGYRFPDKPGAPGEPVPPERMQPMTRISVKSLVGSIASGQVIAPGRHELVGVAFSGEARIARVEVTVDAGRTWQSAKLDPHDSAYGFRVFRLAWQAAPGSFQIGSRATDTSGAVQPVEPVWNPAGYLHNAIDLAEVEVRA